MFEMVSASQDILPGTEEGVVVKLSEEGIVYTLHNEMPLHISNSVERLVRAALEQAGVTVWDWNEEVFGVVHPGGRKILDMVESRLGLKKEKLEAPREVMRQHGNTLSSCVIIVLEEMRRRSAERSMATIGEGLEWGLLFAFSPGITVETILLRALPIINQCN